MFPIPKYLDFGIDDLDINAAAAARKIARGRNVLYHGTRYAASIMKTGVLRHSRIGDRAVFFSKDPLVAAFWARLPRPGDSGRGTIFAFDRQSLCTHYSIDAFCYGEVTSNRTRWLDEMEEVVWERDIINVPKFVLGRIDCYGNGASD